MRDEGIVLRDFLAWCSKNGSRFDPYGGAPMGSLTFWVEEYLKERR